MRSLVRGLALAAAAGVLLGSMSAGTAGANPRDVPDHDNARPDHDRDDGGPDDGNARRRFDLEAHRGGRGLRPENTLASFGNALQIGVTTLELDTGVTRDGVVVVSHERRLSSLECRDTAPAFPGDPQFPYVGSTDKVSDGKLIKDLTLAQIKTLDCGTRHPPAANIPTDPFVGTQQAVPGTKMPTLDEVFALAERYGADKIQFDIETKLDPTLPGDTVDPDTFARAVIDVIRRHHAVDRSLLQTFDWRTLVVARHVEPRLRRVALAQAATIFPGTPWTAGLTVTSANPFDGEVADLADRLGASVLSVNYPDITDALIDRVHHHHMDIVPWTVNDPAVMDSLITRGVDGLITDYPDRARLVMAAHGLRLPPPIESPFDIEAHRGGRADRPENTLASFTWGLDHQVDTLELDTGVTRDGVLVVSHNRAVNGDHCHDIAPVTPGDPLFPYAGKLIKDLTLAQIKTLDCGFVSRYPAGHPKAGQKLFPNQVEMPGDPLTRMPTLQEVFDLVRQRGDTKVRFNIETKISPDVADTVPFDQFTRLLVRAIQDNHLVDRAMIQSFDWRTIALSKKLDHRIETVALIWQFDAAHCQVPADECSLEAKVGDPTVKSTWTAGLDWWKVKDVGKLVQMIGADVVSANWQVHDPHQGTVTPADTADPNFFYAIEDPSIFHGPTVDVLQRKFRLRVVPYTIDDPATMQRVIDLGVDGIISDDVPALLLVAQRNGLR
jgi:glycerophosphoryl diester phosphodiesterase